MSDIDIDAIRARAEAATPGPWADHDGPLLEDVVAYIYSDADEAFIAHAREDVPALLAEVERLGIGALRAAEAERDRLRAQVQAVRALADGADDRDDVEAYWHTDTWPGGRMAVNAVLVHELRAALDTGSDS